MRRTPSTRQYSLGHKKGKLLFGRKCNPVMMKQEGTVVMGKRSKMPPAPHSGLNANRARLIREANRHHNRSSLTVRKAYHSMLAFLVEREFSEIREFVSDPKAARQMLRTRLVGEAKHKLIRGYRVVRNELVFVG